MMECLPSVLKAWVQSSALEVWGRRKRRDGDAVGRVFQEGAAGLRAQKQAEAGSVAYKAV